MNKTNGKIALKVSIVTIIVNSLLSIIKLIAGLIGKSSAMISDSIHSFSDVFSTLIVIIGVKISNKKEDKEHPYGHERMESVAAIILSFILFATGILIGYKGLIKVFSNNSNKIIIPGIIALLAAIISIIVKEWMYWYTKKAAKKINSSALMADAWHHRSDSLSSIGSLIGIAGARMGIAILDPLASVIICLCIIKASCDIFKDAIGKMTDRACDDTTIENMKIIINQENGVLGIDSIKTRIFGDKIYVDLEIMANGNSTLLETHEVAKNVHDKIEKVFPKVKHCMVHVNPFINEKY